MQNMDSETRVRRLLVMIAVLFFVTGVVGAILCVFIQPLVGALVSVLSVLAIAISASFVWELRIRSLPRDRWSLADAGLSERWGNRLFTVLFGGIGMVVAVGAWIDLGATSLGDRVAMTVGLACSAFQIGVAGMIFVGLLLGHRMFNPSPHRCSACGHRLTDEVDRCPECGVMRALVTEAEND
ncbi:MAG: hypothetical protein RLZZ461_1626 [Planctomycetota bacterium]